MALNDTQKAIITYLIDTLEEDNLEEFMEAVEDIRDIPERLSEVSRKLDKLIYQFDDHVTDHLMHEREEGYEPLN